MLDINLLPPRQHIYAKYKTELMMVLFGFILIVAIVYWHLWIETEIGEVEGIINGYQEQINSYESLSHMTNQAPETDYHAYIQATNNIWWALSKLSGQSVCLNELSRMKNKLLITGKAQSIADVEKMSMQLKLSDLYEKINIVKIENDNGVYRYKLRAVQKTVL